MFLSGARATSTLSPQPNRAATLQGIDRPSATPGAVGKERPLLRARDGSQGRALPCSLCACADHDWPRAAGGVLRCAEPTGQLPLSLGARSGCCLRLSSAYTCARAPC